MFPIFPFLPSFPPSVVLLFFRYRAICCTPTLPLACFQPSQPTILPLVNVPILPFPCHQHFSSSHFQDPATVSTEKPAVILLPTLLQTIKPLTLLPVFLFLSPSLPLIFSLPQPSAPKPLSPFCLQPSQPNTNNHSPFYQTSFLFVFTLVSLSVFPYHHLCT